MPFVKILKGKNKGKYRSPSGKIWTLAQMKAYYAKQGEKMNEEDKIIENVKLDFTPAFEVTESEK